MSVCLLVRAYVCVCGVQWLLCLRMNICIHKNPSSPFLQQYDANFIAPCTSDLPSLPCGMRNPALQNKQRHSHTGWSQGGLRVSDTDGAVLSPWLTTRIGLPSGFFSRHSSIYPFINPSIHSFIHLLIHPPIHSESFHPYFHSSTLEGKPFSEGSSQQLTDNVTPSLPDED